MQRPQNEPGGIYARMAETEPAQEPSKATSVWFAKMPISLHPRRAHCHCSQERCEAVAFMTDLFDWSTARFNGPEYVPQWDKERLTGQIYRIARLMIDGRWRTLEEIASATGDPPASISAQLRHLRKERFGSHTINRRPRGDRAHGLFEYQLIWNRGPSA